MITCGILILSHLTGWLVCFHYLVRYQNCIINILRENNIFITQSCHSFQDTMEGGELARQEEVIVLGETMQMFSL